MADCYLKDLGDLLIEVKKFAVSAKEPTLFAIGGCGYYENPASDLLAFFLKPDAVHGLGDLFLSTFLECIGKDPRQFDLNRVEITREKTTANGNKIDLLLLGSDWCLLIENKIRHWPANPFYDYKHHAEGLGKKLLFFAILAPSENRNIDGWRGVSYKDYCEALWVKMPELRSFNARSKWQLFAREFILHLENELYPSPMNPNHIAFVEAHADELLKAEKLVIEYRSFVRELFQAQIQSTVPEFDFKVIIEEAWAGHIGAWRCTSPQWRKNDMVISKMEGVGKSYFATVFLSDTSEPRLTKMREILAPMGMSYVLDGNVYPGWRSSHGYDSVDGAIEELCKVSRNAKDVLTM